MTTLELKQKIIAQINQIDDPHYLASLHILLNRTASIETMRLTDYQKSEIETSQKDFENNRFVAHEDLNQEVKKWLSEK